MLVAAGDAIHRPFLSLLKSDPVIGAGIDELDVAPDGVGGDFPSCEMCESEALLRGAVEVVGDLLAQLLW